MKRHIIVTLSVSVLLTGIALHFWWCDGLAWFLAEAVLGETEYATGYSEIGFRRIDIGDHTGGVLRTLGPPLKIRDFEDGDCIWFYARGRIRDDEGVGSDCCYSERDLSVSNGVVVKKHHLFYID